MRIEQGPLQRLLRLADVHVHTPRGPVNAVAHQLDERPARELALSQLDGLEPHEPPSASIEGRRSGVLMIIEVKPSC